jgi:multiple sugar transport system substrate-binding protein
MEGHMQRSAKNHLWRDRGRFLHRLIKPLFSIGAVLGLVLTVGGCGSSTAASGTISFWNGLVGDDGPAMQRIIREYNATNPQYKVVFQPMNGNDLTTKIYSVMQTGQNIPDLIIGDQFQTSVLQSQGMLDTMVDWQRYEPDLVGRNYLPQTWKNATVNGTVYGIPLYLYQMAVYYNKDLVNKYHLNYILDDGFVTTSELQSMKGKLPKGVYGFATGNLPWAFMSLLYSAGGTLENNMADLTTGVWRKPMEALRKANEMGVLAPIDVDGEQAFGSGKAVFAQLGTWAQGNMSKTLGANKIAEANTLQYGDRNFSNFMFQQNWLQLKDPHRSEARSRGAAQFVDFVYRHWMEWSDVGSISPAYRDLNNPAYKKLIQASFTNSESERRHIKTSNYIYGGYASSAWGSYADTVFNNVSLDEGLKTINLTAQGQIEIQEES